MKMKKCYTKDEQIKDNFNLSYLSQNNSLIYESK